MTNWEAIREEWETRKITFKALAEKHELNVSTVRSRKNREKWQRNEAGNATQKSKNVATVKTKKKKAKKEVKEPVIKNSDLTDKQKLFCIYYLKYFNATKAYQKAYKCAYSTAMSNGHSLLRNTEINREIDRIKEEQSNELKLGLQDIIQKYIDIAFTDITDFMQFGRRERVVDRNEDGEPIIEVHNYIDFLESSELDGTLISEVKHGKDGVSVKLNDKMKALEMLTKYFEVLPQSAKDLLQSDKTKAEIAFIEERTKLIKGTKKDTSILDALIELVNEDE